MLTTTRFPNCCTGVVLYGFSRAASFGRESYTLTKEQIVEQAKKYIQSYKDMGYAIITAITTNTQKEAEEALAELGFVGTPHYAKPNHAETKVKLWHFPLNE